MVRVTGSGPGSMRQTRPSCSPAAQTAPAPTAMPRSALEPTRIVCPTRFVRGSMRLTALLLPFTNHTPAPPAAIVLSNL